MSVLNLANAIEQVAESAVAAARRSGETLTREFLKDHAAKMRSDAGRVFVESRNEHADSRLQDLAIFKATRTGDKHVLPGRGLLLPPDAEGARLTRAGHVKVAKRWRKSTKGEKLVQDGFDVIDLTGHLESRICKKFNEAAAAAEELERLTAERLAGEYRGRLS
ncbi:hypothetical protein [Micromonospora sp. NPDC005299]|uniref:hypothetical protein n=1 Tax=Micromonospora sp. NPDC005299 TaxID=3364231 RepID=UPI003696A372